MRFSTLIALALGVLPLAARADEKLPVLRAGNTTYTNITVTSVSATDVYFTYAGGMGNAKLKNLSPDLQKHFNYDPQKAQTVEAKQAENKLKYHEELLHQPAVQPPDMSRDPASNAANQPAWQRSLTWVCGQAQAKNKLVLLDFTGSDWCPWCIKFDHDVLTTDKFVNYSNQKLLFVTVDFPRQTKLPGDQQAINDGLAKHFGVDGYPTYVLLDGSGKELGRQVGYQEGGPNAFIKELDGFAGEK